MTSKAEPLRLAPLDLPQEFVDAEEEGDAFW
jgi:hypothetical protein